MKWSTLFLACLLLAVAINAALAAQRQIQLRRLPPALAETHPADAFAARLDAVSDAAELRRLALARHRALLVADHTTQNLLATVATINRSDLIQSGVIFLLALGVYFSDRRRPSLATPGVDRHPTRGFNDP